MKKCLFMTVGTGEGIEKGMLVSIRTHNPNKIIFLASEEAIKKKKPLLEDELKKLSCEYEWKEISSHEELEQCLNEFRNVMKKYNLKDCTSAFDITFGTKPMTAALTIIASRHGDSISYVTGGKRDQHGKVLTGTERCINRETKTFRVESAIEEGITLFNKNLFMAAQKLLLAHRELIDERLPLRKYLENLLLLIDLCLAREDFLFEIVSEKFKSLLECLLKEEQELEPEERPALSKLLDIDTEKLKENINNFISNFDDIAENPFSNYRLGELIASAEMAASIGRYNDATARLYRALEFVGQLKLKEHNMIDDELFPLCKVIDGKCQKIEDYKTKPSGLTEIYKCLYSLGHKSSSKIIDPETNQPHKSLSYRNKTILAHGFKPVTEENYKEMKGLVEEIAKEFGYSIEPVIKNLKIKVPF